MKQIYFVSYYVLGLAKRDRENSENVISYDLEIFPLDTDDTNSQCRHCGSYMQPFSNVHQGESAWVIPTKHAHHHRGNLS
jgi:hypothetical protein